MNDVCVYTYVYIYIYITYVYTYVYIYVCIIYIYIYICTQLPLCCDSWPIQVQPKRTFVTTTLQRFNGILLLEPQKDRSDSEDQDGGASIVYIYVRVYIYIYKYCICLCSNIIHIQSSLSCSFIFTIYDITKMEGSMYTSVKAGSSLEGRSNHVYVIL